LFLVLSQSKQACGHSSRGPELLAFYRITPDDRMHPADIQRVCADKKYWIPTEMFGAITPDPAFIEKEFAD